MFRAGFTLLFVLVAPGCDMFGPTLQGDWSGEVDCGEDGSYDWEITVDGSGDAFGGSGIAETLCAITYEYDVWIEPCDLEFDFDLDLSSPRGPQEIEVELDDCVLVYEGEEADTDCGDDIELDWDGQDRITGEIDDCDVELERR